MNISNSPGMAKPPSQESDLRNLFVDFNAYFASVEQQDVPAYRNKPIVVVPVLADSTCAIAASYEAKAYGIKTGTLVAEAKKKCSDLQVVLARHELYVQYHHRLVASVGAVLPVDNVMSIDEMLCSLVGSERQLHRAVQLAKEIKSQIVADVGDCMRCSVGIAPNAYLAKTATDMQKPDGLVVIQKHQLPEILYSLELQDLVGVGRKMFQRLWRNGIYSVEQLCSLSVQELRNVWGGIEGERLWHKLRGNMVEAVETQKSTVGHSHVLEPELRNHTGALGVLHRQLQKAAFRLRKYQLLAGELAVSVKYTNGEKYHDSMRITPTQDIIQLTNVLSQMAIGIPQRSINPLKVSLSLNHVSPSQQSTTPLFEHTGISRVELNNGLDKLNTKYGKNTVYVGTAAQALQSTPMRIAFHHIPDVDTDADT
jgi:DNA polymerase IV